MGSIATGRLVEIADGVFTWLQPGGESGVSNAGVVMDDDGITVIDTLMVRSQWAPFAAAVHSLGSPVRRVVLTHAHIDHVGGTKMFQKAAIYGSPQTSELLDGEMPLSAYKAFMPKFEDQFDDLAEIGTRPVTHVIADAASITPRCELLPAHGHTAGDVMVVVDDADVLFAGDLCFFGVTPLAFQGDPADWAAVLGTIADLGEVIVPGHGPTGGSTECEQLADYLRACVTAKGDPAAIAAGPWDDWLERDPRDSINVERAALLAEGRDEIPPSMVRALGL